MLNELHLRHVGPAPRFDIEFAERLNIFTGDNGLGKSFLLDVAWWALTGSWAAEQAMPRLEDGHEATISFDTLPRRFPDEEPLIHQKFNYQQQNWGPRRRRIKQLKENLCIYAQADGSFAVWDPLRKSVRSVYNFSPNTLWNGLKASRGEVLCNGLIQDWVNWQQQKNNSTFEKFFDIIKRLFQPDEDVHPGVPTRISLKDVRLVPTMQFPYELLPITNASAGMKRVLGLAYILMWTWSEHQQAAQISHQYTSKHLVFLMDEVETHLHPKWQRSLFPSILRAINQLAPEVSIQTIVTTHSPLVLASVETDFDESRDRLFMFELKHSEVRLEEFPWSKQGDTVGWLTSEVFGLKQARSREAEIAIEAAESLMRGASMHTSPAHLRDRDQIHQELQRVLPGHDPFWPRWIVTTGRVSV